jgi:WD40 repeat protein
MKAILWRCLVLIALLGMGELLLLPGEAARGSRHPARLPTRNRLTLPGQDGPIEALAFTHDGKTLATGTGGFLKQGEIKLWDVKTGKQKPVHFARQPLEVPGLAFSADGKLLAVVTGALVRRGDKFVTAGFLVWCDARTGKELADQPADEHMAYGVAFSPDGKALATCGADGTVKLWDVARRKLRAVLKGHRDRVLVVAFAPDGKLLGSGARDGSVKLWDVGAAKEAASLRGHHGPAGGLVAAEVRGLAFLRGGKVLASAGTDGFLRLWDVAARKQLRAFKVLETRLTPGTGPDNQGPLNRAPVSCLAASPDGKLLAVGAGKTVRLWDVAAGREVAVLRGHDGRVNCAAFSPDGRLLVSGSEDRTARFWEAAPRSKRAV